MSKRHTHKFHTLKFNSKQLVSLGFNFSNNKHMAVKSFSSLTQLEIILLSLSCR